MKKFETIVQELKDNNGNLSIDGWTEQIIETFGDYEFKGESEVIVTYNEHEKKLQAYVNHADAPIIVIELQLSEYNDYENFYIIKNVYVA